MPNLCLLLLLLIRCAASPSPSPSPAPSTSPLPADAVALLAFKSKADPRDRLRFPTAASSRSFPHCLWPGVQCSPEGRVVRLVLENLGLSGSFPNASLALLDQLRILSLKSNSLSGPIPDLSSLLNLKALFLDRNAFAGPFPPSLLSLHRLRTLSLSHNRLFGLIPPALASLDRPYVLRLDSNRFSGPVPPLNQSTLKIFDVSANNLSGPVPVTVALSSFGPSAFASNPGLCGVVVRRECDSHFLFFGSNRHAAAPAPAAVAAHGGQLEGMLFPGSASPSQRIHKKAAVVGSFLAGAFLVIAVVLISVAVKKKRVRQGKLLSPEKNGNTVSPFAPNAAGIHAESSDGVEDDLDAYGVANNELASATALSEEKVKKLGKSGCLVFCAGEVQVYTLEQLMRASAEMLGRGSVGTTYKAVLDNRLIVSVKRLDAAKLGMTAKETFERHMDTVGRLRHPNLVPLRAFFQAKEERLLVYDFQPNGSLFSLIHGSRSSRAKPLHWTSCLKIAEDVAQGLAYIHQASRLVHGNVKSSNVLLGPDFEACLTDNCLAVLVEPSEGEEDSGYRAPETRKSNRRLTPRSDIYAFGVLLLELLTGKPPLQHPALIATNLPVWVRSVREDDEADDERLTMLIDISAACVRSSPESRPTTWQVLKMLQEVKEVETGENDLDSTFIS